MKNTYTITSSVLTDLTLFELCQETPLPVITINGKEQNQSSGFVSCKNFPNPCATSMAAKYKINTEVFGQKIAKTIIEYLDKETNQPVVLVFPNMMHVFDGFEENYLERLNHATRRDLLAQIKLRENLIAKFNQNHK